MRAAIALRRPELAARPSQSQTVFSVDSLGQAMEQQPQATANRDAQRDRPISGVDSKTVGRSVAEDIWKMALAPSSWGGPRRNHRSDRLRRMFRFDKKIRDVSHLLLSRQCLFGVACSLWGGYVTARIVAFILKILAVSKFATVFGASLHNKTVSLRRFDLSL